MKPKTTLYRLKGKTWSEHLYKCKTKQCQCNCKPNTPECQGCPL